MKKFVLGLSLLSVTAMAEVQVGDHVIARCGNQDDPIAVEVTAIKDHTHNEWVSFKREFVSVTNTYIKGDALSPSMEYGTFCENHKVDYDEGAHYGFRAMTIIDGPVHEVESYGGFSAGDKIVYKEKFHDGRVKELNGQIHTIYSSGHAEVQNLEGINVFTGYYNQLNESTRDYVHLDDVVIHEISEENQSYLDTFKVGTKVKYKSTPGRYDYHQFEYLEGEILEIDYHYTNDTVTIKMSNTLKKPWGIDEHRWPPTIEVVLTGNRTTYLELDNGDGERSATEEAVIKHQTQQIKNRQNQPQQQQQR